MILLVKNPFLTGVMLLVVPALVLAAGFWSRIIRRLSREAQDALARANGGLQESLGAIETVQVRLSSRLKPGSGATASSSTSTCVVTSRASTARSSSP
ncbi:MAG: hypothetical protein IPK80_01785 [Nannocystis sp.]|nr:hypothetical protein [Nannocystis sp.]